MVYYEDNALYQHLEKRIGLFKGTSMFKTMQYMRKFQLFEVRNGISML